MTSKSKHNYGRQASKEFGECLKKWREEVPLTLEEAAPQLGLKCRKPEAYLSQIETGKKPIPEAVLLNIPKTYKRSPEEVLRKAYWPQLPLSLLTAIMEPAELPKAIEDYLDELKKELEDKEKRELTRYAAFLILRRRIEENTAKYNRTHL